MRCELRLGRWQEALADVDGCDLLCLDPPYSARTHEGQRVEESLRTSTIDYDHITPEQCAELCESWAPRTRNWVVIFCDHVAFGWHEAAWQRAGWLVFAPVFLKTNPMPRFSGDGPALALEFMMVARPRRKNVRPLGSLPAWYPCDIGHDRKPFGLTGRKPLQLIRAVIGDYSLPGDLVVDCFSGSGTTALAARMGGREFVGSEAVADTHAKALARLAHMPTERLGQTALFGSEP